MIMVDTEDGLRRTRSSYIKVNCNSFRNWYCGVGFNFLSVRQDGTVFGSVCRNGGKMGNIFTEFKLPDEPIRCPVSKCTCGADHYILKSKRKRDFKYLRKTKEVKILKDEKIKTLVGYLGGKENHIRINWVMSKRCNYDCSYCPSYVHDNFSPHLSFERFKTGFDNIVSQTKGKDLSFRFTGGEPTINPEYMKMVRHVNSFGYKVHTNTNGTANASKLRELINAGGIRLSIHQEFTNHDKIIDKIEEIYREKVDGKLNIEYMLLPGRLDECKKFFDDLVPEFFPNLRYSIDPLMYKSRDDDDIMYDYSEEELDVIKNGLKKNEKKGVHLRENSV